ncbi:hypothetical protein PINS_up022532 [Pythium insidiosum]|nr:hypothetical protein PINS_up022532 [Pythium insidiosum]
MQSRNVLSLRREGSKTQAINEEKEDDEAAFDGGEGERFGDESTPPPSDADEKLMVTRRQTNPKSELIPRLALPELAKNERPEKRDVDSVVAERSSLRARVLQSATRDEQQQQSSNNSNAVTQGFSFVPLAEECTANEEPKHTAEDDEKDMEPDDAVGDEMEPDAKDVAEEPSLEVDGDEAEVPPVYDEQHEGAGDASDDESATVAPPSSSETKAPQVQVKGSQEPAKETPTPQEHKADRGCDHDEEDDAGVSREELAVAAVNDGRLDVALRLCFLEDDTAVLKRVLTLAPQPCFATVSRASRSALCAAFLELLDDDVDRWLVFPWLQDLVLRPQIIDTLDPRVFRALEARLEDIAMEPSKQGQLAADLLSRLS